MGVKAAAGLGGNVEGGFGFPAESLDKALGTAIPINVRGIEKVDANFERPLHRVDGLLVIDGSPRPTHSPGAEADFRNLPPDTPKLPVFHACLLFGIAHLSWSTAAGAHPDRIGLFIASQAVAKGASYTIARLRRDGCWPSSWSSVMTRSGHKIPNPAQDVGA